jgi:tetratricopeptide (TPR) repeat protein
MVCLALAAGTALLYWPVVTFDYVMMDDTTYLISNFHVNRGFTWEGLRWCFNAGYAANWHPLTWLSHTLDCQIYGIKPGGHHATNVLLHALNSTLLFLALRRMTGAFWRSAMVAALFAWHPLHVESVAWVAERKDVLSCLFFILTVWAYARHVEELKMDGKKGRFFYALALLLFALGLMAKPMLVTLPFVLLLLDWWPLGRLQTPPSNPNFNLNPASGRGPEKGFRRRDADGCGRDDRAPGNATARPGGSRAMVFRLLMEKAPFFFLSFLSCIVTVWAQYRGRAVLSLANDSIPARLSNALTAYFQYIEKVIWPENLSAIYLLNRNLPFWEPVAAGLFLVAISMVAAGFWKTRRYILMGWLWYLGTLVPVIGLIQVGGQAMADRYTYIPSIGLFVLFVWGAWDLVRGWRHGPAILGGLAWVTLIACALFTGKQLQYWQNGGTLAAHSIEMDPNNFIAESSYAGFFLNNGQLDRAQAECEKSIRLSGDFEPSHDILGHVLLRQGKFNQAAKELDAALRINPASVDARLLYAWALLGQELPAEAEPQFDRVLTADPVIPDAHYGLGRALAKLGKTNEAFDQFNEVLRLDPQRSDARLQLAIALAMRGRTAEAVSHYRLAKNVPASLPDSGVMNNLAWILAASPFPELRNGAEAVRLAGRACELDHRRQPMFIGTLAAAYAQAGRFEEAVAAAQEAHDLALAFAAKAKNPAEERTAKDLAARNLELLELYRSRQAYHEK